MRRHALFAIAILAAAGSATRADYYDGLEAFASGDYETALAEWRPLAERGFVDAQYQLARMYHRGYAVRDDAEAAKWYRKAAEQDHLRAQNDLGVLYELGRGVEQDEAEAARWYLAAAQQGLIVARANLAVLYADGRGVPRDLDEAVRWFRLAADAGHLNSKYRLALLFDEGDGIDQDAEKAAGWYRKAAKQGHAASQLALAEMYEAGRGVRRDASKATKWRRLAAVQGVEAAAQPTTEAPAAAVAEPEPAPAPVQPREGSAEAPAEAPDEAPAPPPADPVVPLAPEPPSEDLPLAPALVLLHESAGAGDPDTQYELAGRYASGDGVPRSNREAGKWYLAAAEAGHEVAGYKVAFQYLRGHGAARSKDLVQAHFWFSVSAERGVGDSAEWRDKIAGKMNRRQRDESKALLDEWHRRSPED